MLCDFADGRLETLADAPDNTEELSGCNAVVAAAVVILVIVASVVADFPEVTSTELEGASEPLVDAMADAILSGFDAALAVAESSAEELLGDAEAAADMLCVKRSRLTVAAPGPLPNAGTEPTCLLCEVDDPTEELLSGEEASTEELLSDVEASAGMLWVKRSRLMVAAPGPLPSAGTEPACLL